MEHSDSLGVCHNDSSALDLGIDACCTYNHNKDIITAHVSKKTPNHNICFYVNKYFLYRSNGSKIFSQTIHPKEQNGIDTVKVYLPKKKKKLK